MKIQAQIGLTLIFSLLATIILYLLRLALDIEISKIYLPLIAFPLNIFIIRILLPKKLQYPFGKVTANEFCNKIGLTLPSNLGTIIFLGIVLGLCSLSGMLIGTILTGKYAFNPNTFSFEQIVFAIAPGVWEEVFYRGILMMVLMKKFKNVKKAAIIQCIIFGVMHFYAFEFWAIIDNISVIFIALSFTYVAFKTNSLLPGIIFHFLHDAFLFVVQLPEGIYNGTSENLSFFICLWVMLIVACLITKLASEKWKFAQSTILYDLNKVIIEIPKEDKPIKENIFNQTIN